MFKLTHKSTVDKDGNLVARATYKTIDEAKAHARIDEAVMTGDSIAEITKAEHLEPWTPDGKALVFRGWRIEP